MSSALKFVFQIVGIMALSLLLFNAVFGTNGRNAMWSGIRPALEKSWKANTLNDGHDVYTTLTREFENVNDLSTN